jgi:hypothetical protein
VARLGLEALPSSGSSTMNTTHPHFVDALYGGPGGGSSWSLGPRCAMITTHGSDLLPDRWRRCCSRCRWRSSTPCSLAPRGLPAGAGLPGAGDRSRRGLQAADPDVRRNTVNREAEWI